MSIAVNMAGNNITADTFTGALAGSVSGATTLVASGNVTTSAGEFIQGTVIVPAFEYAQSGTLTSSSTSQTIWVCPNVGGTYQVAGATVTQGTASASGTVQIEVATSTQAIGSGTVQLTGTMSIAGTANTPVNGTVIASPTAIVAGARVNIILAGTLTSLANCVVEVVLQRIS